MTGVNIFVFIKLKGASEQMMKMAFPGAKNMNEAVSQMQGMMKAMKRGGRGGKRRGGFPGGGMPGGGGRNDAQLKAAMDMLQNMQKKKG